jgi:Xaa-Pro aminopeptidase
LYLFLSQLGAQFDGYCSTVATTVVIGAKGPVTGPKADAIKAAETAMEAALRMIRPGNKVTFTMQNCKFPDQY